MFLLVLGNVDLDMWWWVVGVVGDEVEERLGVEGDGEEYYLEWGVY